MHILETLKNQKFLLTLRQKAYKLLGFGVEKVFILFIYVTVGWVKKWKKHKHNYFLEGVGQQEVETEEG